jgi:S1-C subfamily serine protease
MRRVTDWLLAAVQAVDSTEAPPTYVEVKRVERIADSGEAERPSFGSMPAYPNPAPDGVLLEAILEGSAAEKGGIRSGDVLQQLGDSKIVALEDFEGALRKHKPGDKVKVVVRRGDEKVETEVTLGRRR